MSLPTGHGSSSDLASAVASVLGKDSKRILTLAASLKAPGRRIESTVAGGSMGMTLPPGSRIQIEMSGSNNYAVGDVVAVLIASRMVVHRIVHCGRYGHARGYLLTRGDATLIPDPPQPADYVVGQVSGIWRDDRWQAVDRRCKRSARARSLMFVIETAMAGLLCVSPGATSTLADLLWRGLRVLRSDSSSGDSASPSAA
jgi:hypothetical protein